MESRHLVNKHIDRIKALLEPPPPPRTRPLPHGTHIGVLPDLGYSAGDNHRPEKPYIDIPLTLYLGETRNLELYLELYLSLELDPHSYREL